MFYPSNSIYEFNDDLIVTIKVTFKCNLRCKYCLYQQNPENNNGAERISFEVLEKFCDIAFPHFKNIIIIWHGGEPTIVGKKVLEDYVSIINQKCKVYNISSIAQSIQTNGTLMDEELIKYFKNQNISIGISYDGLQNDFLRGKTQNVYRTMNILQRYDMPVRSVLIVSGINCENLIEEYEHAKKMHISVDFSPYEEDSSIDNKDYLADELKISSEKYCTKMEELFHYWIEDPECSIRIEPFSTIIRDSYLSFLGRYSHHQCLKVGLNPNGEIFRCGMLESVMPYGNVNNMSDIREIKKAKNYMAFLNASKIREEKCRKDCNVYEFCRGDCANDAASILELENYGGFNCRIFKELFGYVTKYVKENEYFECVNKIKNPYLMNMLNRIKLHKSSMF